MAMWRGIGGFNTLQPGATAYWVITYGPLSDVGPIVVTPNLTEAQINLELVARDPGVFESNGGEAPTIHYSVRIHHNGPAQVPISYNLNIGDWT